MRIVSLTAGLLLCVASIMPASAEVRSATPIKKPNVLGSRVSTVTTYSARRTNEGLYVYCSGRCSDRTYHWKCEAGDPGYPVSCEIFCAVRPPELRCNYR
jgi:hypothetical protein